MLDAELVSQAIDGSRDAYAELIRRWAPRITAICHARVRQADSADDLTQETFLRGYRALGTLSDHHKVGPWLMGIAARACLDWLKAKERQTVPFSVLSTTNHPEQSIPAASDSGVMKWDERQRLISEVEQLPEAYRQVLMLYYYDNLTYREVGDLLGISAATVNLRLTKAKAILREKLIDTSTER